LATTLSTLRSLSYSILREEEDSSAYPYTLIDQTLNSAQLRICTGDCINPLTKEAVAKWDLPFLNTDYFYTNIADTYLTADATVGGITLDADTTWFSATGKLYIAGNIITYTWVSGTQFTGVTGILFAFKSWERVSQVFTLPTDFMSVKNVTYNDKYRLESKVYDDIFEELNKYKGQTYSHNEYGSQYGWASVMRPFYTIKDWKYLLVFNTDTTWSMIKLRYEKIPTDMTLTTSETVIDNDTYAK